MSLIIRIERSTKKFIAQLNGGVEPEVTEFPSMFLFHDDDRPNEIISLDEAISLFKDDPTVQPHTVEYCIFTSVDRKNNKD